MRRICIGMVTAALAAAALVVPSATAAAVVPGTVFAWGDGLFGELGDADLDSRLTPDRVGVGELEGSVVAIAAGRHTGVAVDQRGQAWMWGRLWDGGALADFPERVPGPACVGWLDGVASVAAGDDHALAVRNDGTVWAWGGNASGQLGDFALTGTNCPVQVRGPDGRSPLAGIRNVAAGRGFSLAVGTDGTVWAWGSNSAGQLGDGTTTNRSTPARVRGPNGAGVLGSVSTASAGSDHALALLTDGTVRAWGTNTHGQLGDGTTANRSVPVPVQGVGCVTQVAAGGRHSLARLCNTTVWAWGENGSGQLGIGSTSDSSRPVQVVSGAGSNGVLSGVRAIAAGWAHSVASGEDGSVWAWGGNVAGQLGDPALAGPLGFANSSRPVHVVGVGGRGFLTGAVTVAAGEMHTLAWVQNPISPAPAPQPGR
jgi:alpha-tubulin suppressor-like RCC1 family protein